MKTLRKNGGFTLVELIVVIAILAILAGVAVPAYSGYIKKANDAAVVTQLDAIKTAVFAANATNQEEITKITITPGSGTDSASVSLAPASANFVTDIKDFYDLSDLELEDTSYAKGAEWSNGSWTAKKQ